MTSPNFSQRTRRMAPQLLLTALLVLLTLVIIIPFFEQIPIEQNSGLAIDWKSLYMGLQGGRVVYRGGSVMIAPWSLPAVLPLGFFSLRAGWGMLALLILTVLILSVPRRRYWAAAVILLCSSWLALRQVVDGNFEVLVIAGLALVVYAFRRGEMLPMIVGLLLATAKPQGVWIAVPVIGYYLLRTWTPRRLAMLAGGLLVVVIPALLLFGGAWFNAMQTIQPPPGTLLDISLWAALGRIGLPEWARVPFWVALLAATLYVMLTSRPTLSRQKAGMLVAASLLLAPYAAGNSVLTVLAIGIIPTFQSRPRLGLLLIGIVDLQLVINFIAQEFLYWYGGYYWTVFLILVWAIWAWEIPHAERPTQSVVTPLTKDC